MAIPNICSHLLFFDITMILQPKWRVENHITALHAYCYTPCKTSFFIIMSGTSVLRLTEVWDMQLWPEEFHEGPSVAAH